MTDIQTVTDTTVNAHALWRAMSAGSLAASKDTSLPMLQRVHVFTSGGQLFAETTDRFRLIRARTAWTGADQFDVLLDIADVKRIIAYVKTGARDRRDRQVDVSLTADGKFSVLDRQGGVFAWHDGDVQFPNTDNLLRMSIDVDGCEPTVIAAEYLADLKPFGTVALTPHGVGKVLVFSVLDTDSEDRTPDVAGVIMPRRWEDAGKPDAARFDLSAFLPD